MIKGSSSSPKKFNPAIINEFVPESPVERGVLGTIFGFMIEKLQVRDLREALLFAEKEITPHFSKENIENITSSQLVDWIKALHKRVAFTLAFEQDIASGKYTTQTCLRWKKGADFLFNLQQSQGGFEAVFKKYGYEPKLAKQFNKIIQRYKKREDIKIPDAELYLDDEQTIKAPLSELDIAMLKVWQAKHQNLLTPDERAVLDQLVIICMDPKRLPEVMDNFAKELLAKMKQSKGDLDDVAAIAAFAYNGLTEIHPFFNCNGRTATILMNLVLMAYGFPSITFRTKAEKDNPKSEYNLLFQNVTIDPLLLKNYIKKRVEATISQASPILDDVKMELANLADLVEKLVLKSEEDTTNRFNIGHTFNRLYPVIVKHPPKMTEEEQKQARAAALSCDAIATRDKPYPNPELDNLFTHRYPAYVKKHKMQ